MRPIFFRFALDYRCLFKVVNKAYRKARERLSGLRMAKAEGRQKPRTKPPWPSLKFVAYSPRSILSV
jgi:hypothetical protein